MRPWGTAWSIVSGGTVIFSLWQFIRAWRTEDGVVTEALRLDPGFAMGLYVALGGCSIMALAVINWNILRQLTPGGRCVALKPALFALSQRAEPFLDIVDVDPSPRFYAMQQRLAKLGIESPPASDREAWKGFLAAMWEYADGRLLVEARQYWPSQKIATPQRRTGRR